MALDITNPLTNFLGLFESKDIDQRAILDSLGEQVQVNYINGIPIDVLEEFTETVDFEITARPVETGFPVTDSRRRLPGSISLVGVQVTGQDPAAKVPTAGLPLTDGPSWKDKYDQLKELRDRQELITLITSQDTYENYLIQSLQTTRKAGEQSDALFFSLQLVEASFAAVLLSSIDPKMIPKEKKANRQTKHDTGDDQGAKKGDRGDETPIPVEDESYLRSLVGGIAETAAGV